MQNKNNSLIITLLIIVILILAYVAFVKPKTEQVGNIWYPETDKIEKIDEPITPQKPTEPKQDPKITLLKSFFKQFPQLYAIRECSYNGNNTYFAIQYDATGDAGHGIYDSNGARVATGGGFVPAGTPVDPLYASISPTCTKVVYQYAYPGNTGVDIYNLK